MESFNEFLYSLILHKSIRAEATLYWNIDTIREHDMHELLGFLQCLVRNNLINVLKFNELHEKVIGLKPRRKI